MLIDKIKNSIILFEQDCRELCSNNYPSIHNRGFKELHLSKAFARRLQTILETSGMLVVRRQFIDPQTNIHLPVYCIECQNPSTKEIARVYLLGMHLISASRASRKSILLYLKDLEGEISQEGFTGQIYLTIICDHWFNRGNDSRSLYSWWLGHMPENADNYLKRGIKLIKSEYTLQKEIEKTFKIKQGQYFIRHPLKKPANNLTVYRYIQMYAVFSIK